MAVRKIFKRFFIFLIVLFVLLIGTLVAIPYFYKDDLIAAVKDSINETMVATMDFKDADVTIFGSFPNLTLSLKDMSIVGQDAFKDVTLYKAVNTALTIDIQSAMNAGDGPISIRKIVLDKPEINILVLPKGDANYDVSKPVEGVAEKETKFNLNLSEYEIIDGHFVYDDRSMDYFMEIEHLDHTGSGHFTEAVFDLDTKSKAEALTVKYGSVAYLSKVQTDLEAIFNIDTKNAKYTLKENDLQLNNLKVLVDGFIQMMPDDIIKMDMKFDAPSNEFKDLLSILPAAYVKDFAQVKSSGKFELKGSVSGDYGGKKETYPAMNFVINVKNGDVKYPTLPMGIGDVNIQSKITKPQGSLNSLVVNMPTFRLKIGDDPIEGRLKLTSPMTDPNIDTKIKGLLNLANFAKAWPMDGVKTLAGIIDADILLKAALSQLDKGDYENVNMDGVLVIKDMIYEAADMPKINIHEAKMSFSPKFVDIPNFNINLGKSDLKGSARIDNILAYISPKKTMKGTMKVTSNLFDVNEWMASEESTSTANVETNSEKPFDRFDFTLAANVGTLLYDSYTIKNAHLKGQATSQKVKIATLGMKIGDSDLAGNGEISNLFAYLFDNQTLHGKLKLRSNYLDVNPFMEEPAKGGQSKEGVIQSAVFLVPDNIDIDIDGNFKKVKYENYTLRNVDGGLKMQDNKMTFESLTANFLDGKMALSGEYNTVDETAPSFDMSYALQNMGFKKLYKKMVTFRKLAPIAKFIDGVFNTKIRMNGLLGEDMMPDLSSLTASGLLETISGKIDGLQPLEKLASSLNVEAVKKLSLKDTKNWFDIKDGKLSLKPFQMKQQGIDMNIEGFTNFSGGMDYDMKLKVPRKLMEKNPVGNAAGKGMDWLRGEASKLGVNVKKSKYVNVLVKMTGSLLKPKVKLKLLGASGESLEDTAKNTAKDLAKQAEDSLRNVANKKLADAKAKAKAEADKAIAEAKAKAKAEADKAIQKAKDEAIKKAGDKAGEVVKDKAKEVIDKIGGEEKADEIIEKGKDILDKWNPFKKKKN